MQARMRSDDMSTGFSQKIALPAFALAWIRSKCVSVGVPITTASMSGLAMISSELITGASVSRPSALAAVGNASATAATRAPSTWLTLRACTWPMRPQPRIPILSMCVRSYCRG
jgi:hypothetical protein